MKENENPAMVEGGNTAPQNSKASKIFSERFIGRTIILLFVALWAVLSFLESAQLHRIQDLSLFLPTELFFDEIMKSPAGALSYIGTFLVQFLLPVPGGSHIRGIALRNLPACKESI